ncbi:hypothetical protein O7630_17495 [Micromonospora sp. WMMD718]|uniref:hypothetical protein n=1 Tax=Micromonospora sp. WMMD718 TaxID=3016098 RepID=UPI000828263C|nr:hypothetical protein [Micromonospora sp. WMMD718]MDG4752739.1 hypothetical protein [Micromonospora sp. WMMD718]SCL43184.1 hypothetical protein GA0070615_6315 [Micromonospora aurantiaca]
MRRWQMTTAQRGDGRLSRVVCLLLVVLVALIAAHPVTGASAARRHTQPLAGVSVAHHGQDCPQDRPSHAEQACPTQSSSTTPVTASLIRPLTLTSRRLPPLPAERIHQDDPGTHLCPRLTQLAVSRT